jgi:hypothetical protein
MTKNNLCLQSSLTDLNLTTQQEVSVDPIQTPLAITAATSLVSITIGVATTLSVIGRWYVKFVPLFRKWFPNTFKSDLDEWLEDLVYRLIIRDGNVRKETNPDKLKTVLKDASNVADLIELDPNEINNYLHNKIASVDLPQNSTSTDEVKADETSSLPEIEREANQLVKELEKLHEVDVK